ncbi:hypothetical protein BDP27DRAFT_1427592 [Rhodocollybia butyracea]|uniref:Uncharacterized protein n=1 Tax=Rhodocollybia butyracea TaxID=206335 RepID=A0A9P5PHI0_9AGAR|nr:hypothetical protein BDP27DRAFT_1427592 [Rhodocollybia butyracea]
MLNYDVITIICAEMDRADILSLGLASKKFLEPALDEMWRKLSSIEPLLSVLPETTLMFLQPIAPLSWDRVQFYASRVREFGEPYEAIRVDVHDSVYAYLGLGKPLFPKLKILHPPLQLCSLNSFTLFLGTSLQEVSWPCDWPEASTDFAQDLGPSLALLVSKSPGLKSLTLSQYTYSGLSLSLSRLSTLESLLANDLPHLEMSFIRTIALLPRLTKLDLSLPAGILLDYTGVENHARFPSLTKIQLWGSIPNLNKFLVTARPKALRSLHFHCCCESPVDWQSLPELVTFTTHIAPSFPFLQDLSIEEVPDLVFDSPLMGIDEEQLWSIFEPLLELKRLERLEFSISLPLSDQKYG